MLKIIGTFAAILVDHYFLHQPSQRHALDHLAQQVRGFVLILIASLVLAILGSAGILAAIAGIEFAEHSRFLVFSGLGLFVGTAVVTAVAVSRIKPPKQPMLPQPSPLHEAIRKLIDDVVETHSESHSTPAPPHRPHSPEEQPPQPPLH